MYVYLSEVVLVREHPRASDPVVYEREYNNERIFTTDSAPSKYASDAKPYGRLYFDTRDNACIVPAAWSDDDALLAKNFHGELDSWRIA